MMKIHHVDENISLEELFQSILNFCDSKRVFLFGGGNYCSIVSSYLLSHGKRIDAVIDTYTSDKSCTPPINKAEDAIPELSIEDGVILSLSEKFHDEVEEMLSVADCNVLELKEWVIQEIKQSRIYEQDWECYRSKIVYEGFPTYKIRLDLYNRYHFDEWHIYSNNIYATDIAEYIESILKDVTNVEIMPIVECGCGLCNIIGKSSLKGYKRIGIDLDENVINACEELYDDIEMVLGSFEKIEYGTIGFLITVNFMHNIDEIDIKGIYHDLFEKNNIKFYIVDEVSGKYRYHHRFDRLLPDKYVLKATLGPYYAYEGERFIKVFENVDTSFDS